MSALIYAIVSCVNAVSVDYCHLVGEPFLFGSKERCVGAMTTRLGRGELVAGRFYTGKNRKVWYECDQKPVSEWTPAL